MKKLNNTPISWILAGSVGFLFIFSLEAEATSPIVINELHTDEADRTRRGEFIELYNNSDNATDLSGWFFSRGINQAGATPADPPVDYVIPDGTFIPARGYLVIAEDPAEVQALFGYSNAIGPWVGKLSNSGETITLNDAGGEVIDEVDYQLGWPWPTVGDSPSPSMELINPSLDNDLGGSWRSSGNTPSASNTGGNSAIDPSPGAKNSVFVTNPPPAMRQVEHFPEQPSSTQPVVISVKVTDPDGISSVTLQYQLVNPGDYIKFSDPRYTTNWTSVTMRDDGSADDALAGDGTFTVTLPGALQTHRRLVRYRITASDALGANVTGPYADDKQGNFAYFVYDDLPSWTATATPTSPSVTYDFDSLPTEQQQVPIYHLITTRQEHEESQFIPSSNESGYIGSDYLWEGALIYDGQVYDHIRFRARGGVWRYAMGKNMWKFDFNRGRSFKARDQFGERYKTDWSKLNFSAIIQQSSREQRGEQGLFESAGFKLHNLAGNPAPHTHFVQFRIIEHADENGPTSSQYDTDFQGLYLVVEQMDGQFLEEHDLPDGNLYKMEAGTGELNNQGPDQPNNKADLNNFLAYENATQTQQWWEENLNLQDYYNFRSIATVIRDYDIGRGKNYFYFHDPEADNWRVLNWDLDLTWTAGNGGRGLQGPLSDHVLAIPDFARDYHNRLREILDLLFNEDQAGKILDDYARFVHTPGMPSLVDADRAMWDYNPILTSDYVNPTRTGHGRYYEAVTSGTFAGMIDHVKGHIANQTANPINSSILNGEASVIPATPVITYTGEAGFPTNGLTFQSSAFSDPQGTATFAGMQWRIGEIYYDGIPGYVEGDPYRYEIEEVWTSEVLTSASTNQDIPIGVVRPDATYRARVRHLDGSGNWSHWSEPAQFVVSAPNVTLYQDSLVISEFMYHPLPATAEELALGYSESDFEWLEIQNISSQEVDMTNVIFTDGIDFEFPQNYVIPAQDYVIVARNLNAFIHRYGSSHPSIGDYAPSQLSNGGERVELSFGGAPILAFTYDDIAPWATEADGAGHSLVLINPSSTPDHDNSANWRASNDTGGTPGVFNFAAWQSQSNVTGSALDDDDGDQIINLLEYATGRIATDSSSKNLPSISVSEGQDFLFTFKKRIGANDLNYTIQISNDLDQWNTASGTLLSSQVDPNGETTTETWIVSDQVASDSHKYVRLRISITP